MFRSAKEHVAAWPKPDFSANSKIYHRRTVCIVNNLKSSRFNLKYNADIVVQIFLVYK